MKLEEGWGTAAFLLGAILVTAWVVTATEWAAGLHIVPMIGAGGMIAGLFLGWSVLRGWVSHLFSTVYGLAWVGFLVGRGLPGDLTWGERITEMAARLFYWVQQAVTGGEGRDTLIFVILISGLFWIIGYSAAWNTYRQMRPWRAILPPGVVALINMYYYVGPAPMMRYLALYIFFTLLYVTRSHAFEQEGTWRRARMNYDPGLRFDFLRAGLALTVVILLLAWTLPTAMAAPRLTATWRRISDPWRTVQEEWQRLFSSLRGGKVAGLVEPFGPSMALGGPRDSRDIVLMDISAPRAGRYYWRGAVYAYYQGDRWEAVEKERILLIPGRQVPGTANNALRRAVIQTVTNYTPGRHMLVGASQPIRVDREAEAYINRTEDAPLEFIRIFGVLPLEAGDRYVITSQVSEADATSLREAGADYPDWVRQRYLQLPASLPNRVRLLAEEITVGASNPYDKAIAIQDYLRENLTYDLTVPEPPSGREYVDYLLFDSRRDYCNGYATAMAVMARSVGIPARLAVGYAQGEYDTDHRAYRVRENDAHSWVEIYFPRYGWIEFEPTVSQDPLIRPEGTPQQAADEEAPPSTEEEELDALKDEWRQGPRSGEEFEWDIEPLTASRQPIVWPWAVGLTLIVLGTGGWWAAENWGFHGLPTVERAYARLLRFGRWLGRPLHVSDTPLEWVQDVSAIVPEAQEPIGQIVDLYVHARFAQGAAAAPEAGAAWQEARPALWRGWLRHILPKPGRRQV